jgi:hypothetical protein
MAKAKPRSGAKKKSGTKRKPNLVPGDPPILVGGGGSTYLWVNLNQDERPVNPSSNNPATGINPGSPTPTNRGDYTCSRIIRTPPQVYFYDGVNVEVELNIPVAGRRTWYVRVA